MKIGEPDFPFKPIKRDATGEELFMDILKTMIWGRG